MPKVQVQGMEFEYDETGPPDGPAILLIMGLGTQMIRWPDPFRFGLAEHGFRVLRFDNRDVGLSSKLDGVEAPGLMGIWLRSMVGLRTRSPYTLDDMAGDALGVLDALGIESAHVVGASMGGMIAQLLAAEHPQRVRSLSAVMTSSGKRGLPGPRADVRRTVFFSRPAGGGKEAMVEFGVRNWQLIGSPAYPVDEDALRKRVRESLDRSYYPQGFIRQLAAIFATGSLVPRIRSIRLPTLVVHGTADPLVPVECGMDVASHIEGARLELIEGMGHDLPSQLIPRLVELIGGHARESEAGR